MCDVLHIPSHLRLGLFVAVYGGVAVYQGMSVQGLSWSMREGGARARSHTHARAIQGLGSSVRCCYSLHQM